MRGLKELKENEYVDENVNFIVKNLQIRMCNILHEFEITLAGRMGLL